MLNKRMQKQKQKSIVKKRGLYIALALALFVGAPVLGAILVQNFTQWEVTVDSPEIVKLAGADADYDGDGNSATGVVGVNLGSTISNGNGTDLAHEEIRFTCFSGDRTYYTDILQLDNVNASGGDDWDVTLTVEADLSGNPAVEDTMTAGAADIWLFTSNTDSTTAVTEVPNPGLLGSLTNWYDAAPNLPIQLDVTAGTLSVTNAASGSFTIPAAEQRQIGLVVDCDSAMVDGDTGTFRVTVASSPQ